MTTDDASGRRDVSAPGIMFALARLVSGKVDAIAFVEISSDAVSMRTLGVNSCGAPVPYPKASRRIPWTAILPGLPVPGSRQYGQMEGDIDAIQAGPSMADALEPQLRILAEVAATVGCSVGRRRRLDIVLVNRTDGDARLEAAAVEASGVLRPIAEVTAVPREVSLADVIRNLTAWAPLRYGYDLVIVDVNEQTRAVRPLALELFPAGSSVLPGTRSETTVTVAPVPDHSADVLALPIVARCGTVRDLTDAAAVAKHLPLVVMPMFRKGNRQQVKVRIGLARPGRPYVLAPAEVTATRPGWPQVIEELPDGLPPESLPWTLLSPGDLDVAVLIELGGESTDVAARVTVARGVVGKFRDVSEARIGVLGYREHHGRYHRKSNLKAAQASRGLVIGARLSEPSEAASVLDRNQWWDAVPIVRSPHAAPVEDALEELTKPTWGWRPQARHVIVIVGRRPPHPGQNPANREDNLPHGHEMWPCDYSVKWQEVLAQLRKEHMVECHVVLDRVPAPGYDARTWQEFGEAYLRGDSAEQIAQSIGLVPSPKFCIPLVMHCMTTSPTSGKRAGKAGQ